ncbi:unnamed protein product [Rangifer tarandus platyrhynchus]|uniref:Uncharacterized protein n=2 Tax=Rangifer tarandus platyrhynchus TaxID=3082113 RepID=A0ACB0DPP8_RANTA|nr:unnamed protein product [Rangifer tarandus platyrhynchus]CAI9690244.1 unnamed protein product [Rangifer tarandus platyrhynchus]
MCSSGGGQWAWSWPGGLRAAPEPTLRPDLLREGWRPALGSASQPRCREPPAIGCLHVSADSHLAQPMPSIHPALAPPRSRRVLLPQPRKRCSRRAALPPVFRVHTILPPVCPGAHTPVHLRTGSSETQPRATWRDGVGQAQRDAPCADLVWTTGQAGG